METWCHYVKSVTVCTHSKSIDIRLAEVWTYFLFGSFITNFDCLYWTNGFEILKSDDFRRRNVPCFNFWIQTHLKTGEFCFSPTCLHSGDPTASKIQIRFSPWLHIPERGTPSLPSLVLATKPRSCSGHCLKWESHTDAECALPLGALFREVLMWKVWILLRSGWLTLAPCRRSSAMFYVSLFRKSSCNSFEGLMWSSTHRLALLHRGSENAF